MTGRRGGFLAAGLALLCVTGVTWGLVHGGNDVHRAAPAGTSSTAPLPSLTAPTAPSGATATTPGTRVPASPSRATAAPTAAAWQPPAPVGLTGPVSQVLADAPATGPVRISTLAEDAGHPRITVTTAVDRAHAAAAVQVARAVPHALAVAVDHRIRAADAGTTPESTGAPASAPTTAETTGAPSPGAAATATDSSATGTSAPATAESSAARSSAAESSVPPGATATTEPSTAPSAGATPTATATASAAASPTGRVPAVAAGLAPTSRDPYRSRQWALTTLRAETAWTLQRGTGQTVAVVDTGVDGTHPDLARRLLPGIDIVTGTGDGRTDPNGHGTHVAGIIDAIAGNGVGVAGLADGASILPVRVLDADGAGWSSDVAQGVIWATDHGASVINMSLAADSDDPALASAVGYAESRDVVVVAAAGNERTAGDPVEYPAAYPGVLAVAATDASNRAAGFSEEASYVGVAAPGVSITSTYPVALGGYETMSGTSMASPYAAATAALVRAAGPRLTAGQVIGAVESGADDLGAPGRDDQFGYGLIDPVATLRSVKGGAGSGIPAAPAAPHARPGDRSAVVSWTAPSSPRGPVTRYTVTAAPGGRTVTTRATTATVTGLTNGVTYTFRVTATNAAGTSAPSARSAPVRVDTAVRRYVVRVYRDLLKRDADPGGLGSWSASLQRGTSYARVANALTGSTEFRSRLIRESYTHYLGRDADRQGLKHWVAAMARGLQIEQLQAGFITSAEFYRNAGTTRGWIADMYRSILGRSASRAEIDRWQARLRSGLSRTAVASGFLYSTEHLTTVVNGYYQQLLGRTVDPAGARHWVTAVQRGAREEQIIAAIVSSPEYRGRA